LVNADSKKRSPWIGSGPIGHFIPTVERIPALAARLDDEEVPNPTSDKERSEIAFELLASPMD